jgi:hypothetical protein
MLWTWVPPLLRRRGERHAPGSIVVLFYCNIIRNPRAIHEEFCALCLCFVQASHSHRDDAISCQRFRYRVLKHERLRFLHIVSHASDLRTDAVVHGDDSGRPESSLVGRRSEDALRACDKHDERDECERASIAYTVRSVPHRSTLVITLAR